LIKKVIREPITLKGNCANGYFMAPTVIEGLSYDCRVNQEEIFGPFVTLIPFDHEEEVINWSNASTYGLAASIWTENVQRAHRIAHQLRCGIIWVNCWLLRDLRTPFGGMNQHRDCSRCKISNRAYLGRHRMRKYS
jgi:aminomuconate-semialdehyde/2-hydroxymuconate-6-semialdehyde dehydrogenase